jgi:hypothetical protein
VKPWFVFALFPAICFASDDPSEGNSSHELISRIRVLEESLSENKARQVRLEAQLNEIKRLLSLQKERKSKRIVNIKPVDAPQTNGESGSGNSKSIGRFPDQTLVLAGEWPQSINIPGTSLSMAIGGFVQAEVIADRDDVRTPDLFLLSTFGSEAASENVFVSARSSRINIDVRNSKKDRPIRIFMEADFRGETGNELLTNAYNLRLRHAFAQWGDFYAGQWWSSFVDVESFPEHIDVVTPAGRPAVRQSGVRYAPWLNDSWRMSIAIENPENDIARFDELETLVFDEKPDLHAFVHYRHSSGHLRLAVLGRDLSATIASKTNNDSGYGFNFTGRQHVPHAKSRHNVTFGLATGSGIGRYFTNLAGGGLDAVITGSSRLDTIDAYAAYFAYQHWWSDIVRSTFSYGRVAVESSQWLPSNSFLSGYTATANVFITPIAGVSYGFEAVYGYREMQDNNHVDALRLQSVFRARF